MQVQTKAGVSPAEVALGKALMAETRRAEEGLVVLEAAARKGLAEAQYLVGDAYSAGVGTAQDYVKAHMWLNLAAAQGYAGAAESRDVLTELMTAEQIGAAQAAARDFVAETPDGRTDQ